MGCIHVFVLLSVTTAVRCESTPHRFGFLHAPVLSRPLRSLPAIRGGRVRGCLNMLAEDGKVMLVGIAADSGCGKSTFLRRLSNILGGKRLTPNIGRETNTLVSDTATIISLDDYHSLDRKARTAAALTPLDPAANNFDLMYEQLAALKRGEVVEKPVYNHVTGELDPPERIEPTKLVIVQGFHPMFDERVRELLDFSVYLDVNDEVKYTWKIQRDMIERGRTLEQIRDAIDSRKPDFDAYVDPQKQWADMVVEVLPTQLIQEDDKLEILRVRLIQSEDGGKSVAYLFDEGSTITWIPCGRKLTCSYPGIKFNYGPDNYYGKAVGVLEMDGRFDKLDELLYVENQLRNTGSKFYGEITQNMLGHSDAPGADNGTGLFQTVVCMKIRETYENIMGIGEELDQSFVG